MQSPDTLAEDLVVVGGATGNLRILALDQSAPILTWYGHGGAINELAVNPNLKGPDLFLSCSEDASIRLWCLRSGGCIAVFGGAQRGHRDQVLSIAWSPDGNAFVSGGVDGRIMIWQLPDSIIEFLSGKGETPMGYPDWFPSTRGGAEPTIVAAPIWSSSPQLPLHSGCVGCVRWIEAAEADERPFILSKSVDSDLVLWRPFLSLYNVIVLPFGLLITTDAPVDWNSFGTATKSV